jgi:superfamily II DNA or RNA helicase
MNTEELVVNPAKDVEQRKILSEIEAANFYGIIEIPPRVGKTRIGILTIESLEKSLGRSIQVLWITPEAALRDKDIPADFKKFGAEDKLKNVLISTWRGLTKIKGYFDFIIADEYQFMTENNSLNLFNGEITWSKMIAMSATPPKDYFKRIRLRSLGLQTIVKMDLDYAVDKELISDFNIKVVKFDLSPMDKVKHDRFTKVIDDTITNNKKCQEEILSTGKSNLRMQNVDFTIYGRANLIYQSAERINAIRKLKNLLGQKRGLIFTPYKKDAEALGPYYHSSSGKIGKSNYEDFRDKKINQLFLVKAGGVGHTYEGVQFVIVGQVTKDKTGITTQNWGRGLVNDGAPVEIYVLCARDTVEEQWLVKALEHVNKDKIEYLTI